MKELVYLGPSHYRELGREDYEKLDLKMKKGTETRVFARGHAVEVTNEEAKAFLESPLLEGEFAEYDEEKHAPLAKDVLTNAVTAGSVGGPDGAGETPAAGSNLSPSGSSTT